MGEADSTSALVLDDECCNSKDLDHVLFGRLKEFTSLANLKMVLKTKLIQASMDFNIDERVSWVEIEGVPFKTWPVNTFRRIASKNIVESFKIVFHGKVFWIRAKEVLGWVPDFMDDSDEDYDTNRDTKTGGSLGEDVSNCGDNKSDDKGNKSDNSLKYPSGFTPVNESEVNEKKDDESKKDSGDCSQRNLEEKKNLGTKEKCLNKNLIDDTAESVCSGHFKNLEAPRT
uniref:Nucleotide-binding alpha-beta plait domain-containing protein n=1 Tax=Tanacetum cinerariifolium TaxID=118510 RepID=A0A699IUI2_TANCI|nr:hypothetical protein [Tanacetum cinerariifolium]